MQQRSLNALQMALNLRPATPLPKSKSRYHLWDQTDNKKSSDFDRGAGKRKAVAYIQYVAEKDKLCNSIMILAELDRLGTTADKVLFYPHSWVAGDKGTWNRLLGVAEQRYGVVVRAVNPLVDGSSFPFRH